jgi:hypothetical protein
MRLHRFRVTTQRLNNFPSDYYLLSIDIRALVSGLGAWPVLRQSAIRHGVVWPETDSLLIGAHGVKTNVKSPRAPIYHLAGYQAKIHRSGPERALTPVAQSFAQCSQSNEA